MNNPRQAELLNSTNIFTIGHSTMSLDKFLDLLRMANITAVADVRSSPFSKRFPHFNKPELYDSLKDNGLKYVFLGKELGGRPNSNNLYCHGVADYEKMALEPAFAQGIERVIAGSNEHKIALMCSEHNPLDCHRCLLVGRALSQKGLPIAHIFNNGKIQSQHDIEQELLMMFGGLEEDMFSPNKDPLNKAYRSRAMNVAYRKTDPSSGQKAFSRYDNVL